MRIRKRLFLSSRVALEMLGCFSCSQDCGLNSLLLRCGDAMTCSKRLSSFSRNSFGDKKLEGATVRKLEHNDLAFVHKMTMTENWNDRIEDIRRMFDCDPNGSFMAELAGQAVGHVFTIKYGKLGWVGLLIVRKEYRRKGIGRLLTEKAKDHLLSERTKTVKLEAVPTISDLYRKLGFVDEYDSLRFVGTAKKVSSVKSRSVTLMNRRTMADLARFDAAFFGEDRTKVLSRLYEGFPQLCFVSRTGSEINGYIMCRIAESGYKLGPWVCDPGNIEVARDLLMACLCRLEPKSKVYVGVPAVNLSAVEILQEIGFQQYSKSIRMWFGERLQNERVGGIFAICSPMKG
jgi:ribosomal protein S18 acetylase RimI-like enzyme